MRWCSVGVVSAGRVGAVLGAALRRAGHPITGVTANSARSRARAAALLPGVPLADPWSVAKRCELLVLAVPDDGLSGLVAELAARGAVRPGQFVVHTSGVHAVRALHPVTDLGAVPLAVHPAMTFTGQAADLERLRQCSFAVTTRPDDTAGGEFATGLVVRLGGLPVIVAESARGLYHTGLSHGANHLAALVADCLELLRRAGVGDPAAMARPLLSAALDNALATGPAALTGPVARGDLRTVRRHLDQLGRHAPELLAGYRSMALRTGQLAVTAGLLDEIVLSELRAVVLGETARA